jgi:GT2 family glycosyltransferase
MEDIQEKSCNLCTGPISSTTAKRTTSRIFIPAPCDSFVPHTEKNRPSRIAWTRSSVFTVFRLDFSHAIDPRLFHSDSRETRTFDFDRYELSKLLPAIVESLATRKCFQTNRSDFVTVELICEGEKTVNYHVYFTVSKAAKRGYLNLYISSAYVANRKAGSSGRSINFLVILHRTMNRIRIKA